MQESNRRLEDEEIVLFNENNELKEINTQLNKQKAYLLAKVNNLKKTSFQTEKIEQLSKEKQISSLNHCKKNHESNIIFLQNKHNFLSKSLANPLLLFNESKSSLSIPLYKLYNHILITNTKASETIHSENKLLMKNLIKLYKSLHLEYSA